MKMLPALRSFAVLAVLVPVSSLAQVPKVAEPEYKWKVYYVNAAEQLQPLESMPWAKRAKSGLGKNKFLIEVKESKSAVRFTKPPIFAVKVADSQLDPDQQLNLYKMEQKGGRRSTVLKSVGTISKATDIKESEALQFARYGDNCLLIKADELPPGEYGFFLPFSTQLYLFGID